MGGGGTGGGGMDGGGMGGGGTGGSATSLTRFTTADFSGSGNCATCHSGLVDAGSNDVSIDTHWRATMMANAGKDPLWQAKIASEINRNPSLKSIIEGKCSRCHMGMARTQAVVDGTPVAVLSPGFLDPANPLHAAAMDGVSCALCHQIEDVDLGTPVTFTGQYKIDTSTSPPLRLAYGPFSQPLTQPMEMQVGFSPRQGAQTLDSDLCGSCHTLYTPIVDAAGNITGEFPEQTTYLEWRHATNGGGLDASCQDCHMPFALGGVAISNRPMGLTPREPFGQHHFVGGNSFMLGLLKANATALGVTAEPTHLDLAIARTDTQLRANAAAITISGATLAADVLSVSVSVQNNTGHKLPTGIPARRAWLHVTVKDSKGAVFFESGKPLVNGSIAGNDADADAAAYEPHYDRITAPAQVQIYEPVLRAADGGVTYTLLRAVAYAKDNRLLPAGFAKETAAADFAVVGAAAGDPSFAAGGDRITYQVGAAGKRRPLSVTVELLYQSVGYRFAEDLRPEPSSEAKRFMQQYDAATKAPRVMAAVTTSVR